MSNEPNKKFQTNEEMISELTKDLSDYCIDNVENTPSSAAQTPENLTSYPNCTESDFHNDHQDCDGEDNKSEESNNLNDYVDEDKLKQISETLTEDERLQRHNKSLELKAVGNTCHKQDEYLRAVEHYTDALRLCPIGYQNDRAILYCNRAASKIQLKYKSSALDDCTKAIELNPDYVRAYLRRAKLYEETDKLDESLQDYKKVLEFDAGNPDALKASVRLPPLINERNEKMKTEMLGKLKDLGNMILKPFGLSTNNFKMQQDPNSGGYTVNFQQNSN